jgi:hypothetical protein
MTNNPTMKVYGVCDFCDYDAEVAVKYQIKQNEEVLSPEEYDDEVAFYLFESHPYFCKPMAKAVGAHYVEIAKQIQNGERCPVCWVTDPDECDCGGDFAHLGAR